MISSHSILSKVSIIFSLIITLFTISCNSEKKSKNQLYNHLAKASSPYLIEHADNPVHWYEWGDEALLIARKENKPIIISIGYAACHWCHVMESETFMDTAVANYMNAHFVSIKVDREERPDLDEFYLNAAMLINGEAGWPLNAVALPDGRPFYAGTYFKKSDWMKLLVNIQEIYISDNASILSQSDRLTKEIQALQTDAGRLDGELTNNLDLYKNVYKKMLSQIDFRHGGFVGSPKFALPVRWEFMLQADYLNRNKDVSNGTEIFLNKLATSGVYDHLGGGFCRYATDEQWRIPHFEKMLYDNAQLVSLYAHAYQYTGNEHFRTVIDETLAFVKRELTNHNGGFYSSINADSEGREGKFYTWRYGEIAETLTPMELTAFNKVYLISPNGNWERGHNILQKRASEFKQIGNDKSISEAKSKLFNKRAKRKLPSVDDKILTSWNALMLKGYVDAHRALGDSAYLSAAISNALFLEKYMIKKNFELKRCFRNDNSTIDGFLEDYAFLADAMLYLYQTTFDKHWLLISKGLVDKANILFKDSRSPFYIFSTGTEKVIAKRIVLNDGVIPSANAIMALTQFRIGKILYDDTYKDRAISMLEPLKADLIKNALHRTSWGELLGMVQYGTYEVGIVGKRALALNKIIQRNYLPNAIFVGGKEEDLPMLEGKKITGSTRIYICRERVCQIPTDNPIEALKMIRFRGD